jgi:hypothetical protein
MIYRLLVDNCDDVFPDHGPAHWPEGSHIFLRGAGLALGDFMEEIGLPGPDKLRRRRGGGIKPYRARFFFTELGWRKFGRKIFAEARRRGHNVRVIRRKNPSSSQVVFRDRFQVAVLPPSRRHLRTSNSRRRRIA